MRRIAGAFGGDRSGATAIGSAAILLVVALGLVGTVRALPSSLNAISADAATPLN